jgi:hypothetical protein
MGFGDFNHISDQLYTDVAQYIFKHYINENTRNIFIPPVQSNVQIETAINHNGHLNVMVRLKRMLKSSENDEYLKTINISSKSPTNIEIEPAIFLQIIIQDFQIKNDTFQIRVALVEKKYPEETKIIREIFYYKGKDENIQSKLRNPIITPFYQALIILCAILIILELLLLLNRVKYRLHFHRLINQENYPYFGMHRISLILFTIFIGLLIYFKQASMKESRYFTGAEIHFFIDHNSGLSFNTGENNFKNIAKGIIKETCHQISDKVNNIEISDLEKKLDKLTYLINRFLVLIGLEELEIKKFPDLMQSDYKYKIYTFSENKIDSLVTGDLSELVLDYDSIIAPAFQDSADDRESSLIMPLLTLHNQLLESNKDKKKFIILFTDVDEYDPYNVREFLSNVNQFYDRKNQYLRVFSILFPNIPRTPDPDQIFPFENGKIILLSKLSEFIVYLNNIERYTPDQLVRDNSILFENLINYDIEIDINTESYYQKKIDRYRNLLSKTKHNSVLSIHDIAAQNFLNNYVKTHSADSLCPDFFFYTYVDSNLYNIRNLNVDHAKDWFYVDDYNLERSNIFGIPLDSTVVTSVIQDIVSTFVNQFILIDREPDKKSLISKIIVFISIFILILSLINAWLLFRFKFEINYRFNRFFDLILNAGFYVFIFILLVILYAYFQFENRWEIYGNGNAALCISFVFMVLNYLPAIYAFYERRFKHYGYIEFQDTAFIFDDLKIVKGIERLLFNYIIVPLMTFFLFLLLVCPVSKSGIENKKGFLGFTDHFFQNTLNLSNYNNVIDKFIIVWFIIILIYLVYSISLTLINPSKRIIK